jgi:hypothetical protein
MILLESKWKKNSLFRDAHTTLALHVLTRAISNSGALGGVLEAFEHTCATEVSERKGEHNSVDGDSDEGGLTRHVDTLTLRGKSEENTRGQ